MARVSIYVPDELKGRMDKAGDAINWSEIARPAFLSAIAFHEHREGQNMATTIERLRASKAQHFQHVTAGGGRDGRNWATNHAEYADLVRIAKIEGVPNSWSSALKSAIDPTDDIDWDDAARYLRIEIGIDDEEYYEAFVKGAQEVFAEVEDKL